MLKKELTGRVEVIVHGKTKAEIEKKMALVVAIVKTLRAHLDGVVYLKHGKDTLNTRPRNKNSRGSTSGKRQ